MPNGPIINPIVLRVLVALLTLAAVVAFVVIFGAAIWDVWRAPEGVPKTYGLAFVYVATTIASLVGGTVAVGFGVSTPDNTPPVPPPGPAPAPPPAPAGPGPGPAPTLLTANVTGLGTIAVAGAGAPGARQWIGSIYAVAYILLGIGGVVTWVAKEPETAELVKNLATTFIGLMIPIVTGYFRR